MTKSLAHAGEEPDQQAATCKARSHQEGEGQCDLALAVNPRRVRVADTLDDVLRARGAPMRDSQVRVPPGSRSLLKPEVCASGSTAAALRATSILNVCNAAASQGWTSPT